MVITDKDIIYTCRKCKYEWKPKRPKHCPHCGTICWNRENKHKFITKKDLFYKEQLVIWDNKQKDIIAFRAKYPCATLQTVGDKFGVTRERIRQVLKKNKVKTRHYTPQRHCARCNIIIPKTNKSGYCSKCKHELSLTPLICDACGKLFYRATSQVLAHAKHPEKYKRGSMFCSLRCKAVWLGKNYGKYNLIFSSRHKRIISKQTIIIRWLTRLGFLPIEIHHITHFPIRHIYNARLHYYWGYDIGYHKYKSQKDRV